MHHCFLSVLRLMNRLTVCVQQTNSLQVVQVHFTVMTPPPPFLRLHTVSAAVTQFFFYLHIIKDS